MNVFICFLIMLLKFNDRSNIIENAIPYYNEKGEVYRIDYNLFVNEYVRDINLDIFGALREYKKIKKNDKTIINVNIKGKKKYYYVKDSFNIETDSFETDKENYEFLGIEGFDGRKINKIFIPWKENLKEKEELQENIKKAYDYFYLNILDFSYDDKIYYNMDNYKDIRYKNGFKLYIRINDNYSDIYKDYNYYGKISFQLRK